VSTAPVALADDLGELHRREPVGESPEQSAGVDLRQLTVVTDQDQLALHGFDNVGGAAS